MNLAHVNPTAAKLAYAVLGAALVASSMLGLIPASFALTASHAGVGLLAMAGIQIVPK